MTTFSATEVFDMEFNEVQQRQAAQERFERLLALDERVPERAALREAGVPERTISNLYPHDFGALVPGLIQLLTASAPRWDSTTDWSIWVSRVERNCRRFSWAVREAQRLEILGLYALPDKRMQRLEGAFARLSTGLYPEPLAEAAMYCLTYIWWAQIYVSGATVEDEGVRRAINELFAAVIDWALPELMTA